MMSFRRRRLRFALGVAVCFLVPALASPYHTLVTVRSFFGVYRVSTVDEESARILMHGTTTHGAASLVPGEETMPTTYYSQKGPFGRFFAALEARDLREVGIIGLGTGNLGCYAKPPQRWTFYEIDPLVERLARDQRYFQFMARCGNHPRVIMGDARLTLTGAPDRGYDALVIDAFSSDSIPTHLLTREALDLYFRKLAPHGVILFHISNMYLDLAPVIAALASSAGAQARYLSYQPEETNSSGWRSAPANVMAVSLPGDDLDFLTREAGWVTPPAPPATALWTDQRSDILRTIHWLF
jgi:spermidine synthase